MREPENQEMLRALEGGRAALFAALSGVGESLALLKPPSGGWSTLECVEHLVVTERALLSQLKSATQSDQPHENPKREAMIQDRALDRTRHIDAPEIVVPSGRFGTLSEAVAQYELVRTQTVRYVEEFSGDPRSWLTTHPMVYTPVNCYEMLLMMALHPARHARQIVETLRALSNGDESGQPKSGM